MHFDWSTLILQTVNVLVLLWLLRRFLFRPVAAIIAERRAAAEKLLTDATAVRAQANGLAEQTAQREKALAADGERILTEAAAAAETERAAVVERSRTEAAKVLDAAQSGLEQQRAEMRRALETDARGVAVNTALVQALGALPVEQWRALAGTGETVEVITASALDEATQAACVEMVRQRIGCAVRFGSDPSLIAGVALTGPHARLDNNWRADLDRIAEELSHDDKHPVMA
jgi:F-type H+-transporting ATPase subunit b